MMVSPRGPGSSCARFAAVAETVGLSVPCPPARVYKHWHPHYVFMHPTNRPTGRQEVIIAESVVNRESRGGCLTIMASGLTSTGRKAKFLSCQPEARARREACG